MAYISLYRKYRPRTFFDLVGQNAIVEILKNAIINNKISHAYIFSGPRGTGKTSMAKIMARTINCENIKDGEACGKCISCKNIDSNAIDIIEIDAASNNGVDEIREIRNNVKLMPSYAKYKVYIIDEVHMLSTNAFNALLKTLEEPPSHVIFILATTEINKIPTTVLSRCQKFDFKRITIKTIENRIKQILKEEDKKLNDKAISLIAKKSDGGLRDAINLLEQVLEIGKEEVDEDDIYNLVGDVPETTIYELLQSVKQQNLKPGLSLINSLSDSGRNFCSICDRLLVLMRNIIIYNNTHNYFDKEYEEKLSYFSDIDIDKGYKITNLLFEVSELLKKSNNQKILFEIYFIKINSLIYKIDKDEIIENQKIEMSEAKSDITEKNDENINDDPIGIEYKKIRINNALALAEIEEKQKVLEKFSGIKDYLCNKEYNAIANLLGKTNVQVVSKKNILFTFKNEFETVLFDKNIEKIEKLLKIVLGHSYKIIAVNESEWLIIKERYVNDKKNGITYTYTDEKNLLVSKKKNSKLENAVESVFGDDIVVVE